jgi:hypothetical protein
VAYRPAARGLPGFVALVKRVDRPSIGGGQAMT